MKFMRKQQGVTLIEVILVLMISTAILYLSIQQYLSYRQDADIARVRYNVDMLFNALTNYFRANCKNSSSPFYNYYFGRSFAVDMATLTNNGYLTTPIPDNPLVDNTAAGGGYVMQFNQYQLSTGTNPPLPSRTIFMSSASGAGAGRTVDVGYILVWQAQVAVKLINPSLAESYKGAMGANCISSGSTGWGGYIVMPCDLAKGATDYLVWSRSPSYSSSTANSPYWLSLPLVKEFSQMYSTDPILILTDQTQTGSQFYRCGS